MAKTKTEWRWEMAMRLAKRMYENPSDFDLEVANHLVWRLCRLANDNVRNCERDNDPRWMENPRMAAKQERIEERWCEREREIDALFAEFGCSLVWPGLYPSIRADEGYDIDIWEMY